MAPSIKLIKPQGFMGLEILCLVPCLDRVKPATATVAFSDKARHREERHLVSRQGKEIIPLTIVVDLLVSPCLLGAVG